MGFEVFGVGVPEMVMILVVALIFLGPERLPDAARTVGGWVREIRNLTSEATSMWQETLQVGDTLKEAVRLDVPASTTNGQAAPPAALPAPPVAATVPMTVAYTPPAGNGAAPEAAAPVVLDYPAPFAAPAPRPPQPEQLHYPAPFEE